MQSNFTQLWKLAACGMAMVSIGLAADSAAADLIPVGGETQINITTADTQFQPTYAHSSSGDVRVAVWTSLGQDGDGSGVFARFDGLPLEIPINETTLGDQVYADVSISDAGSVVFVWQGEDAAGDVSVYARVFDNAGGPVTPEFLVEGLSGDQKFPFVDHFPNGNFVVSWLDVPNLSTKVSVFTAGGIPLTSGLTASVLANQAAPHVSAGPNDYCLVGWRVSSGVDEGMYCRVLDSSGAWLSNPTLVSQSTALFSYGPKASSSLGKMYLSWLRTNADNTTTVFTRPIDATGAPMAPETAVALSPVVTTDLDVSHDELGQGVVVWAGGGVLDEIYIQCLDDENPVGTEQLVNTTTSDYQTLGSVCLDNSGDVTVAWSSREGDDECFIQRYELDSSASIESGSLMDASRMILRAAPSVFSGTTRLSCELPVADRTAAPVLAAVYDARGRQLLTFETATTQSGRLEWTWNGRDHSGRAVAAGTYWLRVTAGDRNVSKRLVVVR